MTSESEVYKSYEKIADWFDECRSRELLEKQYLDKVIDYIKPGGTILDLGCGMGEPIAEYFINQGLTVVGVDACERLIELAKERFPNNRFILNDMRNLCLNKKFDAIIAWNSFFHLNQDEQRAMFQTFEDHMKPGGILLFTSGPDAGEVWSDNGGEMLYHASLSPAEYRRLFEQHNFKELLFNIEDPTCGDATVWMATFPGLVKTNR
jgi:cyclopropane fatty-acyl-phospholipid synthase-like methyltransferase